MNRKSSIPFRHLRVCAAIAGAFALSVASVGTWAANDLDTPTAPKALNADGSDTFNTVWLGHNDLQGRVVYQTTVHSQNGHVIAYSGHFNGTMLNPMTGNMEINGTSIVDVTDPTNPIYLKHLIADKGGARMAKLCDGNVLPNAKANGIQNKVFLLRENGAVSHEVWDVTTPANPTLVSTPVSGLDVTHRSWWDCSTGIAYIVGGATKSATAPDGWNPNSSPNQHLKIYDLSNPAHPKYIMDFGYPGQNPGSKAVMPGTTNLVPPGVHGPIVVSTFNGRTVDRIYMPYGVSSDGFFTINQLSKVLPPPYGTAVYADPSKPTDAELLQGQIGIIYEPGAEGGHSMMPVYGVPLTQYSNFTSNNVRDLAVISSEEVDNRCTGAPHLLYLMDITQTVGAGGHTSAEQHPWPMSAITVNDFSGRPNYCSRGTRFGVHAPDESFFAPYYGKLVVSAWFDAGLRVTDIRDPYHPVEVAHFVPPVTSFTQPSTSTINGVAYSMLDVSCDNPDVDDAGLLYCGDRVGGGLDIVQLTGPAAAIGGVGLKQALAKRGIAPK